MWTTHVKIAQNMYIFPQISHLSSNRREQNLAFYFQFTTPARKLTHNTKFKHFWMQKDMNFRNAMILHHFGPEKCQKPTQKDMNFGNTIILCYLGPEKCQNPTMKDMNFGKLHSLTPAKMPANKESIHFSRIPHLI